MPRDFDSEAASTAAETATVETCKPTRKRTRNAETVVMSATETGSRRPSLRYDVPAPPTSEDLASFANELRAEFDPKGPMEVLLVELLIRRACQLRASRNFPTAIPVATELSLQSGLVEVIEALERCRMRRWPHRSRPSPDRRRPERTETDESTEEVSAPRGRPVTGEGEPVEAQVDDPTEAIAMRWQDHLVHDFNVSEVSPVVRGTWITARHVVSLIVDGWSWQEILRAHPELSEDDIRACLSYTLEEEGGLPY